MSCDISILQGKAPLPSFSLCPAAAKQREKHQQRRNPRDSPTKPDSQEQASEVETSKASTTNSARDKALSETNSDGSMSIGQDKKVTIDVKRMCSELGVEAQDICPVVVVSNHDIPDNIVQRRCHCPEKKGHRNPQDYIHAKSLKLRAQYSKIRDRVKMSSKKRPLTAEESGTSKKQRHNVQGDGPGHISALQLATHVVIAELFAGICSPSAPMVALSRPNHSVVLGAFSESQQHARDFVHTQHPQALDLGPYSQHMHTDLQVQPTVVVTTFECAPYAVCGHQRMHNDSRAQQVTQSADFVLATTPHLVLLWSACFGAGP